MISSNAISHTPAPVTGPAAQEGGRIRHTLSLAASFLIVMSVALAGWFATMQLNQPGGSDGQFGLFGQIDESATCDVEPMTVDEVIQRLEQPVGTNDDGESYPDWWPDERLRRVLWITDAAIPPHNYVDQTLLDSFEVRPDEESFEIAREQMNGFLACAQNGTMGQAFWYIRPFELHRIVMAELPLYRDEAAVRTSVENLLPMPATGLVAYGDTAFTDPGLAFQANPKIAEAAASNTTNPIRFGASETIMIGITVTDQSGEIVFQNDYLGRVNPAGPLLTTERFRLIMGKSLIDEQWYVLAVIPE